MAIRYRAVFGLLVGVVFAIPASAFGDDPVPVSLQLIEGDYHYEILTRPGLTVVDVLDEDGSTAARFLTDSKVAFPRGYDAEVIITFKNANNEEFTSAPISIEDGRPKAPGGHGPSPTLAQTAAQSDERTEINVDFANGTGKIAEQIADLAYVQLEWLNAGDFQRLDRPNTPAFTLANGVLTPADWFMKFDGLSGNKLRLVFTDGTTEYQSQEFQHSDVEDNPSDQLDIFATGESRGQLFRRLEDRLKGTGIGEDTFKDLVVDSAAKHDFHPNGAEFVFRYDRRPYETAAMIADLLRKTAADLKDKTVETATADMTTRFEEFYKSGKNPYSERNPYVDDWQPFLKDLKDEVMSKVEGLSLSESKVMWSFVLISLADGFDEIVKRIEGTIEGDNPPAAFGSNGATYGSGTTTRERRRVSCWNLLFGL